MSQDGYVADAGHLPQLLGRGVVEQTGDRKRLPVQQFDLGLGAARAQGRNAEALQHDRVGEIKRADFRSHLETDAIASGHRRREAQTDAELLEDHADGEIGAAALCHGNRELAASQEAGFLAAFGDEIRFGQALKQPLVLQRLDGDAELILDVEQKQVEKVAEHQLVALAFVLEIRGRELLRGGAGCVVLVAVGAGKGRQAQLGQRAAADFGKSDAQQHLRRRPGVTHLHQADDVFLLVDIASRDFHRLVSDVLGLDGAGDHDRFAVAFNGDRFPGEQFAHLLCQPRQVALDGDVVAHHRAAAIPQKHRNRARQLALHQHLVRPGDHRISDVRTG